MREEVIIGMVGAGGDGVVAAGDILLSAAALDGLYGRQQKSFGPQIRGGESSCRVRISTQTVYSAGNELDALIIFSWKDYARFGTELPVNKYGNAYYEEALNIDPCEVHPTGHCDKCGIPIPFTQIAVEKAGTALAKNLVALGVIAELYNIAPEKIQAGIERRFTKKGGKVVRSNIDAFIAGREWASKNLSDLEIRRLNYKPGKPKMIMDGNAAFSAGAIYAGCKFFAGYPITPASEIMQWMNDELPRHGCPYVQAEDEIAAAAMVAGASFTGAKVLTATSGPGMSLKTEILGMATMAELPMVVINVQRGGPSTGLPTKSEQSDLFQALYSASGDVVRPVLAPRDIMSCFTIAVDAFNIAEEFQTPVVVLSDQWLGQSKISNDVIDTKNLEVKNRKLATENDIENGQFKRYKMTEDLVSPFAVPGTPGLQYLASGIEHAENGWPSSDLDVHQQMNKKRIEKLKPLCKREDLFLQRGDPESKWGILSWGGASGAVRDAIEMAEEQGISVKALIPYLICPIAKKKYEKFFESLDGLLIVEVSYLGQLYTYLKTEIEFPKNIRLMNTSNRISFMPEEILDIVKEMQKNG